MNEVMEWLRGEIKRLEENRKSEDKQFMWGKESEAKYIYGMISCLLRKEAADALD